MGNGQLTIHNRGDEGSLSLGAERTSWERSVAQTKRLLRSSGFDERLVPVIALPEMPSYFIAYSTGAWLDKATGNPDLMSYSECTPFPLAVIEDKQRRQRVVDGLLACIDSREELLFGDSMEELDACLDALISYRNKNGNKSPLYRRWKQQVGKKERWLATPNDALQRLLTGYVLPVIRSVDAHPAVHGGERGWTPKMSVASHIPCGSALSFDLRDAFMNTHLNYVFAFFHDITTHRLGNNDSARDVAGFLSTLSTVIYDDFEVPGLPQGAPHAMALFNRTFKPLDILLAEGCAKRQLRYSRWVDDIIISSPDPQRPVGHFLGAVDVVMHYYHIAPQKLFFQHTGKEGADGVYLMGHKILGRLCQKVANEEAVNRGRVLISHPGHKYEEIEPWYTNLPQWLKEEYNGQHDKTGVEF